MWHEIPDNIRRGHVEQALSNIDPDDIPGRRRVRDFYVAYEGDRYPPKFVISKANRFANGTEHDSEMFSGGYHPICGPNQTHDDSCKGFANCYLEDLGFDIRQT